MQPRPAENPPARFLHPLRTARWFNPECHSHRDEGVRLFAGQWKKRIAPIMLSGLVLAWCGHCFAAPAEAEEESLAELARRSRAASAGKSPRKVITNADLKTVPRAPAGPASVPEAGPAAPGKEKGDPEEDRSLRQYYYDNVRRQLEVIQLRQAETEAAARELDFWKNERYKYELMGLRDAYTETRIEAAAAELAEREAACQRSQESLAELRKAARKAGVGNSVPRRAEEDHSLGKPRYIYRVED
mgnify:CR=1 FL=1